jgi:predicted nuclease of restriction endonuclease-like (RecB) superfamily
LTCKKLTANPIKESAFYKSIAGLIQQARSGAVRQLDSAIVITHYEIGRRIVVQEQYGEKRAQYGKKILQGLSEYLTGHLGKGWSVQNLKLMRQFYMVYSETGIGQPPVSQSVIPIGQPPVSQFKTGIFWKHYILLMRIKNIKERRFYEIEIANNGWSFREFERQYNSSLYERLVLSRNKKRIRELSQKGQIIEKPQDLFKQPYVLEFTGLPEMAEYSETELEQKLVDHLQQFLLELGKGFAFVGRQVRFTFEEDSFFVDLVFYNRLLKCFVLFDLKIGKLKPADIGQMQMYVNYYDRTVKLHDENPTIGIVLCKDKKDTIVEMMLPQKNKRIFTAQYQTVLPSKDELRKLLEDER